MPVFTDAQIAEMAHELHRGYNHVIGYPWDDPTWPALPQWHRDSVIDRVRAARARPGQSPRQLHDSWKAYFTRLGWKRGPARDPMKKTHPDLADWDDLTPAEQMKDVLFAGLVRFLDKF